MDQRVSLKIRNINKFSMDEIIAKGNVVYLFFCQFT